MKASLHSRYGPADRLQIQDIECPIPRSDEILVKIHAATVSSGDCNIRNFTFVSRFMRPLAQLMFGVGKPWKPRVLGT
ncbi:MAG TPA: NAD(P)-dependent alcohol dehydrogenase, partial [bacterium]|nr:NAD(P)-dependent alcohol dehydrogenase [bacterium]